MLKGKDWCIVGASKDRCLTSVEIPTDTSLDAEKSWKILSQAPNPFAAISHLIALERYDLLSHSVIRGSFFILVLSN